MIFCLLRLCLPLLFAALLLLVMHSSCIWCPGVQAVPMAFDLLPNLRPRMWRATICVCVCRKWEYRGGTDDAPIQHVDLVLLDEKGNSMYAEIPEQEVEAKSPLVEEDGIYVIGRFRVLNAKSGYRPVNAQFMVEFTLHTTIMVEFYDSFQNQKLEISFVRAPTGQQGYLQVAVQREQKTLRELNAMDTYDFAENGYRCSVTIGRLLPGVSWWFPSCVRCSKSCVPDGTGYRCNSCSATSFKFKYKISFVAIDGTDEAEMVCFGDIARRMVGKPVQQVLRTAGQGGAYPPDITKIVAQRFTFALCLTQQSYYRQQKTYQVVSVITSHGQQAVPPPVIEDGSGKDNSDVQPPAATSQDGTEHVLLLTAADDGLSTPSSSETPLPVLHGDETPLSKSQTCDESEKLNHPKARKRLDMDDGIASESEGTHSGAVPG